AHFTFDTSLNSQFFPGTQDLHGGTLQPGGYTSPATFADITINGFDTYALPSYSFFGQIIESPNSVDSYDAREDGYNFILLDIKQCCGTAGLPGGIPGGLANSFIIDQPPNTTYEGSFAFYDPGALGHAAGQLAPNHIEVSVTPTVGVPGPAVGAGL